MSGRKKDFLHHCSKTPEYRAWQAMKNRCLNKNSPYFGSYGGRGICVSKEWLKFDVFLRDMGKKTAGTSLDRIDNNSGYRKENCRWATPKEQARNRRSCKLVTINGKSLSMVEWNESLGGHSMLIQRRLKKGWKFFEAFTKPIRKYGADR